MHADGDAGGSVAPNNSLGLYIEVFYAAQVFMPELAFVQSRI